jgi:lambda repressor-like predicted transcriptional regulator
MDVLTAALRTHGWTIADLCEGLGYRRSSTLPFTRDKVTARQARQIENLIAFLAGDETRPDSGPAQAAATRRAGAAGHEADAWAVDLMRQGYSVAHAARCTGLSESVVASLDAEQDAAA